MPGHPALSFVFVLPFVSALSLTSLAHLLSKLCNHTALGLAAPTAHRGAPCIHVAVVLLRLCIRAREIPEKTLEECNKVVSELLAFPDRFLLKTQDGDVSDALDSFTSSLTSDVSKYLASFLHTLFFTSSLDAECSEAAENDASQFESDISMGKSQTDLHMHVLEFTSLLENCCPKTTSTVPAMSIAQVALATESDTASSIQKARQEVYDNISMKRKQVASISPVPSDLAAPLKKSPVCTCA